MADRPMACPCCGGAELDLIGAIPASNVFAGIVLDCVLEGGALWRCRTCTLHFRWPRLSDEELKSLYQGASADAWQSTPSARQDWTIAAGWLKQALPGGGRILDVGCATGQFLVDSLGDEFEIFGIEINAQARHAAEVRGVRVIGSEIDDVLSEYAGYFSSIVAFDILEHCENPLAFIEACTKLLAPEGRIVAATGSTSARTWRWSGSRYWYCSIPEHISFVSEDWCRYAADRLRLRLERIERYSHAGLTLKRWLRETLLNGTYLMAPAVFRAIRSAGFGPKNARRHPELSDYPPGWMTAKDHIIFELASSSR